MIWLLAHGESSSWLPLQMTPIHPILVNFTAALVPVSFAAEVLGRYLKKPSLTGTAWWTLLVAAMVTPLTAAAGWYWKNQMDMPGMDGRQMAIHQWLGISLTVLFIAMALWRGQMFRRDQVPGLSYLGVLAVLCALLTLQGHLGGVMSFGNGDSDATGDTSPAQHTSMNMSAMTESGSAQSTASVATISPTTSHETGGMSGMTMDMPTPTTSPAPTTMPPTAIDADAEGWRDSISVKGR